MTDFDLLRAASTSAAAGRDISSEGRDDAGDLGLGSAGLVERLGFERLLNELPPREILSDHG